MGALRKPRRIERDEFFSWLAKSAVKADWYDGLVLIGGQQVDIDTLTDVEAVAMAGGTRAHSRIGGNAFAALDRALAGRPRVAYNSDLAVQIDDTGLYVFPDATVVCGPPIDGATRMPSITNPTMIVEVLSEGTSTYDLGAKLQHYRRLASVQEVLIIASDRVHVEVYRRLDNGDWLVKSWTSVGDSAELASLAVSVPLAELYARVEFTTITRQTA